MNRRVNFRPVTLIDYHLVRFSSGEKALKNNAQLFEHSMLHMNLHFYT